MATPPDEESFGRTILRGAAWGLGFAVVSVPIGILLHSWLDEKQEDKPDRWREGEPWHHDNDDE